MRLRFDRVSTVTASPPPGLTSYKASLLAVAILLLTFQAQTVKIFEPEGQFEIEVPAAGEWPPEECYGLCLPNLWVSMEAAEDGRLSAMTLSGRHLGHDEKAFQQLNAEILKMIGRPGNPLTAGIAVELLADERLNYEYLIRGISACTGRLDPATGEVIRYINRIILVPPGHASHRAL